MHAFLLESKHGGYLALLSFSIIIILAIGRVNIYFLSLNIKSNINHATCGDSAFTQSPQIH